MKLRAYDSDLPQEQQCKMIIEGTLTVTSFNDKKVKWRNSGFFSGSRWSSSTINIPAGTNSFIVNYKEHIGGAGYYYKDNMRITFRFEAGQTYKMKTDRQTGIAYIIRE